MRLAGSYSSILSRRFRKLRCSVPCDNRYSCKYRPGERGQFCWVPRPRSAGPDSPLTAYTWLSRGVRPWSSGSSPDAPGGSISAVCDEVTFHYGLFPLVRVRTGELPAPLDHPARNRPLDPLHHSQVLPVVVSLQTETSETLIDKILMQHGGRRSGRVTWYRVKPS